MKKKINMNISDFTAAVEEIQLRTRIMIAQNSLKSGDSLIFDNGRTFTNETTFIEWVKTDVFPVLKRNLSLPEELSFEDWWASLD